MRCPYCGHGDTTVKDSRPSDDGNVIRRRRECPECGSRFTTFERVQLRELTVIKRNGEKRPFDREKLIRSIAIACRKRPVTEEQIEITVNNIVRDFELAGDTEISVERVGASVMDALPALDKVAFIRFASVYKDFDEARDFEDFLRKLEQ